LVDNSEFVIAFAIVAALLLALSRAVAALRSVVCTRRGAGAAIAVAAIAFSVAHAMTPAAVATNPLSLTMSSSSANVFVGAPFVIDVEVGSVSEPGIGAFDLEIGFNPAVVSIVVSEGPFLSSTGNPSECATSAPALGRVLLTCGAIGLPASGPQGRGVIASIVVEASESLLLNPAYGAGAFTLLDGVHAGAEVRDVNGAPQALASVGDTLLLVRPLEGDINGDCNVNVADSQAIVLRYNSHVGSPMYAPHLDLEPSAIDGDIDIKDVQFVFGREGSTCGEPKPPQPAPPGWGACGVGGQFAEANSDSGPPPPFGQHGDVGGWSNGPDIPGDDITIPNGDALADACDPDSDNDGRADVDELAGIGCGGAITEVSTDNAYSDGDPPSWDTDGDAVLDGAECALGTDPTDSNDKPSATACGGSGDADGDGLPNSWETCKWGTSNSSADSDGDGLGDCLEAMDVNGNVSVNATDATQVLQHFFGVIVSGSPFVGDLASMDVNGNSQVNATDATLILQAFFNVAPLHTCF
jgi:hypothetical protein